MKFRVPVFARRRTAAPALACLLSLGPCIAHAQILQFSRDQIIEYTKTNPFDRLPDGRPKVPDDLLKKLASVSAEEIWTILHKHGYDNQYAGDWRILQPGKHLVGRAFTVQFLPRREDLRTVAEDKANASLSFPHNANQRAIDMLQNGDVMVVDLYG